MTFQIINTTENTEIYGGGYKQINIPSVDFVVNYCDDSMYTGSNLNLFGNPLDNGKVDKYTSLGTRERSESEREQRSAQGNPQSGGLRLCILVPQLPPRISQMAE